MMTLKVNGQDHAVDADPDTPLLYVLRNDLKLNAAKFGCGLGQCGSCTVIVDGKAVLSCVTPILLLEGKQVTTLEGLGTIEEPAPIQRAFMEEQAAQCGYCIAGMIMRAQALLQRNSKPTDAQIRAEIMAPLHMDATGYDIFAAPPDRRVLGYRREGGAWAAEPDMAEDVAREVWLRALRGLPRLCEGMSLRAGSGANIRNSSSARHPPPPTASRSVPLPRWGRNY